MILCGWPLPEPRPSKLNDAIDPGEEIAAALDYEREMAERDREWWDDDPTAYDLPMTGATYLRPGERRNLA